MPTAYAVSVVPFDHPSPDAHSFTLTVQRTNFQNEQLGWAIRRASFCLSSNGEWDYEPLPSSRDDDWLEAHRFPLQRALALAERHAPDVKVNGWRASEFTERHAELMKERASG